jgi:hypothetical protein
MTREAQSPLQLLATRCNSTRNVFIICASDLMQNTLTYASDYNGHISNIRLDSARGVWES